MCRYISQDINEATYHNLLHADEIRMGIQKIL